MKKATKWILAGTGALMAGATAIVGVSRAAANYFMKIALDREIPDHLKNRPEAKARLVGSPEVREFTAVMERAAKQLESSGCEQVGLTARDGERLIGHWYSSENAQRTIIAMHGWRSSWARDFGTIADFWHDNDCNVLYVEQRGQNNSGGDYMGFGLLERYDCLDWIEWVDERFEVERPIYLAGVSMGATSVLMAAGLDLPSSVCGIIADCGFTSPYAIWKHVAEHNLHMSYGICAAAAEDLCKKKIHFGPKEYSTVDAMRSCSVPVLFIHGTDDAFVPVEMSYENYKACASPKKIFVVPGADHGMSYFLNKTGYEKAIKDFWDYCDW